MVAVEAAGTGVFPLETDERASCVDDMDILSFWGWWDAEKIKGSIPTVWEPLKKYPRGLSGADAGTLLGLTKLCC